MPAAALVRFPAVVPTVKLVPAPDAADMFVATALLMLTSCPAEFAFALMFAAETVRALPPVPIPPAVDVRFKVGVVISPEPVLVMLALAVRETEVVPFTAPERDIAPALDVRLTVCALIVPAAELVTSPAVVPTVKLVPAPDAPAMFVAAALVIFTSWPAAFALALMLVADTVRALPPVPIPPAVDVRFKVGVVIVPKLAFVMPALAVRLTNVVPVTVPARASEPALDVMLTVCALMVPAAKLVRLPAVVPTVKLVPAPDAPEIFVVAALVMLTSCPAALALALMLADETVRAVPAVPTLPAVDVTFKVGVVIVAKLAFVMPAFDVSPTDVVPVMVPLSAREPALDVRLTVCALTVPAAELVKLPAVVPNVKLVPAPDAAEIFAVAALVIFTSWPAALALALTLAAETVKAVPTVPMLPAVDVTFNVGVVIVPKLAFVIPELAVRATEVVPVTAPLRARAPALDVRLTV